MDKAEFSNQATKAFERKSDWDGIYEEIYTYILPYRHTKDGDRGKKRMQGLYDSTAVMSAFRFAGRMQAELTPPEDEWMQLVPGPLFPKDKREEVKLLLQHDNEVMGVALNTGNFHTASMESYSDLVAGTGVLLVLEGEGDELVNYVCPPFSQIAIKTGPYGAVEGTFWKREYSVQDIVDMWPDAKARLDDDLKKRLDAGQSDPQDVVVMQGWTYNRKWSGRKKWEFKAILPENEPVFLAGGRTRTSPAVVTRFFRLPGEDQGRGPGMIALPNAKVANKAVELILQAAAIALFGIFTVTDDGLLNPDKAELVPGAMWQVESNASGSFGGRSIDQLDLPKNFSVTDIVIQDQRTQVKSAMMDDQLPPEAGAVRSPTEIIARQRGQSFDIGAAFGRLMSENLIPLVQRVYEILENKGVVTQGLNIDQKIIRVKSVSPLAQAQNMAKIERIVSAIEIALGIGGQELAMLTFKFEDLFALIGELFGVPADMMRTVAERGDLQKIIAEIIAQQQLQAGEDAPAQQGELADVG